MKHSETVTLASYQLAWNIARAKKPYNGGEFIKTCVKELLRVATTDYESDLKWIVKSKKCQKSH